MTRAGPGRRAPHRHLARAVEQVGPDGTVDGALTHLVRCLVQDTGARYAAVRAVGDRVDREVARWPRSPVAARVDLVAAVPSGELLPGPVLPPGWCLVLGLPDGTGVTGRHERALRGTARCVGVLARVASARADLDLGDRATAELEAELVASRRRLRNGQRLERRRVVTEMLSISSPRLARIRRLAADCEADLDRSPPDAVATADLLGRELDELIDRFRKVVRGLHSTVLAERGLREALAEVADDLPYRTDVSGDLPGDPSPEVETALYHAVTAALRTATATGQDRLLRVRLGAAEDGLVGVTLLGLAHPGRVLAGLSSDVDQMTALGGVVDRSPGGGAGLRICLPDRFRPVVRSSGLPVRLPAGPADAGAGRAGAGRAGAGRAGAPAGPVDLPGRVADLLREAAGLYAGRTAGLALARAAGRLEGPVRAAVCRHPGPAADLVLETLVGPEAVAAARAAGPAPATWYAHGLRLRVVREPGGTLVEVPVPALRDLTLGDLPGRAGAAEADVALHAVPAGADPGAVLAGPAAGALPGLLVRAGPGGPPPAGGTGGRTGAARGILDLDPAPDRARQQLAELLDRHVRARSGVLRARTALQELGATLDRHPVPDPRHRRLLVAVERLLAAEHELTEVDTLAAMRSGAVLLDPAAAAAAERLLGAEGRPARVRLGLDRTATGEDVRAAAAAELERWRRLAGQPGAGPGARRVCLAVVRTCEGLLAADPEGRPSDRDEALDQGAGAG